MSWSSPDTADVQHPLLRAPTRSREVATFRAAHAAPSPAPREATETAHAHAVTVDQRWRVTAISPQAAAWMGLDASDVIGRDLRKDLLPSAAVFSAIDAALATGQPSELLLRSLYRPGRWLEFQVEPTGGGARVSFRDVTSEAPGHHAALAGDPVECGAGGDCVEMALLDARGSILSVNAAWREAFATLQSAGRPFGVGARYEDVCRQIIPDLEPEALRVAMRHLLAGEVHALTHAYLVVTAAGPRWRQIRILPLKGDVAHFIAVREDLTEGARSQAALRQTTEQLRSAKQEERHRIAGELHDFAGSHLAALGLGVSRLRRLMASRGDAHGILDDMASSIDEAAKEIRVMSYLTKPPSLHRDGLEASARRYVKGFGIRTGLDIVFRCEGRPACVRPVIQHAAFRVIQEALSNVHRHARASAVKVELAIRATELTLRIADDGRGIAPMGQARVEGIPPGVGIPGMRSRVEHLGGQLDIASSRAGVVVTARIPLPRAALSRTAPAA